MRFITLEQADQAAKTDGEDQQLLETYALAAEARCERMCNRMIYEDQDALDSALLMIPINVQAARAQYDAAVAAAELIEDEEIRCYMISMAQQRMDNKLLAEQMVSLGMVAGDDFRAAVLLTTCHFYANREDTITGQGANAVSLPHGARAILEPYLWPGNL